MKTLIFLLITSFFGMIHKPTGSKRRQRRAIADNNCDAVIILGDSRWNGADYEFVGMDTKYLGDKTNILMYYKPDRTASNNGAWETYNSHMNNAPGYGRPSGPPWSCGPMTAFGSRVNLLTKKPVAVFKVSLGGSGIITTSGVDNDWWIPSGNVLLTGELFEEFYFNFLRLGLRYLDFIKFKKNVKIKCAFIAIGTNDCAVSRWNATNWRGGVLRMIDYLRAEQPELPIYWEGPRPDLYLAPSGLYTQANVDACNAILDDIVNPIHADYRAGVTKLNYNSLPLLADGVHNTVAGDFTKGEANADIFLAL